MVSGVSVLIPPQATVPFTASFTTLRATDSDVQQDGQPFVVRSADSVYIWDAASVAVDDGSVYIRPDDRTSMQAGRWILANSSVLAGSSGSASVGFIQAGTGAVPLTVQTVLRDVAVTPEQFGAVGNGVADDTAALQRAFNTGRSVVLRDGKTYLVSSKIMVTTPGITVSGSGTIKVDPDWDFASDTTEGEDGPVTHLRVLFVSGWNISFHGVQFDATGTVGGTGVENAFIWLTGGICTITGCRFFELPKGAAVMGLGSAPYFSASGNHVNGCTGAFFAKGRNPLMSNNTIIDCTDAALVLNGVFCVGGIVSGNTISNETGTAIPSMIAVEEGASSWIITNNILLGVNGGGIVATNVLDETLVEGGAISNNVVDAYLYNGTRPNNANPTAGITIGDRYKNCVVKGNKVHGAPSGNAASRLVILPANGTMFEGNLVDASDASGLSAYIDIVAGTGGIRISNNDVIGVPPGNPGVPASYSGRLFLFGVGDYGGRACAFSGGRFLNAAEGINAQLNWAVGAGITNFVLSIQNLEEVTTYLAVNGASAIGDRATFLNAGATLYPHRIGKFTEMRCSAIPAAPGALPYQNGDTFYHMTPTSGGFIGVVRVPGLWQDWGPVS